MGEGVKELLPKLSEGGEFWHGWFASLGFFKRKVVHPLIACPLVGGPALAKLKNKGDLLLLHVAETQVCFEACHAALNEVLGLVAITLKRGWHRNLKLAISGC